MKKIFTKILAFTVVMLIATAGFAATIHVPGDYSTIQVAVNNARTGDIIMIAAGTYNEDVTIGIDLTLQGPDDGIYPNKDSKNKHSGASIPT